MGFITTPDSHASVLRELGEIQRKFMVCYLSGVQISRRAAEDEALPALYERFGAVTNQDFMEVTRSMHARSRSPDSLIRLSVSSDYKILHEVTQKLFDQRDRPMSKSSEEIWKDLIMNMRGVRDKVFLYGIILDKLAKMHRQQSLEQSLLKPSGNEVCIVSLYFDSPLPMLALISPQ
ncbi:hypothetical protein BD626DRAFT_564197 [Schizophyllum amplum]|uniref:Uncharacterized protein n=1 Tax=Schizophyllum amplum TaxID=97359 RepID=A0A550D0N0_9AGAR|nr:hypothetical protein BD626DRAFT_564197 [Auriculariopsis ampla]